MPNAPALVLTIDGRAAQVGAREFESAVKRIQDAGGKTEKSVNKVEGSFKRLRSEAGSLRGTLATLGASIGIGVIISSSVRKFSELEKGLVGVAKTANLSDEEITQLRDKIASIAQVVPETTTALLSIAQAAGQLGVTGVDNIALFTETVGKLGGASDLAGEEAATTLARILNVTKEPIDAVDNLASSIVALGNNFAASESEIAGVALRVAQQTTLYKLSSSEIVGLSAALKAFGVQAERAGGGVSRIFQAIAGAISEGGDKLNLLARLSNTTGKQLTADFGTNAFQVFVNFVKGLSNANLEGVSLLNVLKKLKIEGEAELGVIGTLKNNYELLARAISLGNVSFEENVALNQEAARAATTFSSQMTFLQNSVDAAASVLGSVLAPALLEVSKDVRTFLVNARDSGELERIFKNVGTAASFLANNSREVSAAFAAIAGTRLGAVFGPWGALVGGLAAGFGVLATRTDEAKAAQDRFNIIIDKGNKVLEESIGLSGERAKALEAEKRYLIDLAQAEIEKTRAQLEARKMLEIPIGEGSPIGGPDSTTTSGTRELEASLSSMEQRLKLLRSGVNEFVGGETSRLAQILRGTPSFAEEKPSAPPKSESNVPSAGELKSLSELTVREQRLRETRKEAQESTIKQVEANRQLGRSISQEVLTPLQQYEQAITKVNQLQQQGNITQDEARLKLDQLRTAYIEGAKQTDILAQSITTFGDATTSAFERALFQAQSFQEVLNGLIQDLGRVALRTAGNQIFGALAGLAVSSSLGGGQTSSASGGATYFGDIFGFKEGGPVNRVRRYASGGPISGPGTGISDSITVQASKGEYIVNSAATRMFYPVIDGLNQLGRRKLALGGPVSPSIPHFQGGGAVGSGNTSRSPMSLSVTNNITVENKGSPGDASSNEKLARSVSEQIKRSVKEIVVETLVDESRGGGFFNSGITMR